MIFDLDGVLIDSALLHQAAWAKLASEEGRELARDFFPRNFGERNEVIVRRLFGPTSQQAARRLIERKEELFCRDMEGIALVANADALLRALRGAGARLALLTAEPRSTLRALQQHVRLDDRFDVLLDAADVANGKPAPDGLLLAASRLGVAPSSCVAIDDAPIGIAAARRAGMWSVWVRVGSQPPVDGASADRVVDHLTDITVEDLRELVGL